MSLISTYDLRLWMGIEEGDRGPNEKLKAIANVIEDFCDSYTNRALEGTTYTNHQDYSYYDGNGLNYFYLKQYPVSYVSSVNMDADRVFGSGTLFASDDYYWYPLEGKLRLNNTQWPFDNYQGGFYHGRRNILVNYTAGYAPVVGGTYNSAVSSYPIPSDLKQVMTEMCVEAFKEGMTAVHSIVGQNIAEPKFIQMLTRNSFWYLTLNKYKSYDRMVAGREE